MGTEVLRPQDLLAERFHVQTSFHRRGNFPANNHLSHLIVNKRPTYNAAYKRTSPKPEKKKINESKKSSHGGAAEARRKEDRSGPAMGQVTLLKRGESLDSLTAKVNGATTKPRSPSDDLAVRRIGPNSPEMVPKQIRLSPPPRPRPDVYAGSAFSQSPSPRSVPLPSFFNKKQQDDIKMSPFDDPATRDLRRLLRLD